VPGSVTGKPTALGGMARHGTATAKGVVVVSRHLLASLDASLAGKTAVVQGFGRVGGPLASFLADEGVKIVAVTDRFGAVFDEHGLDIDSLTEHCAESGTVAGFRSAQAFAPNEIWSIDCDIAVPAALAGTIDEGAAADLRARFVIEAANGPTTGRADEILDRRDIVVIPDVLANAGGVTSSYLEWMQNRQGFMMDEDTAVQRFETFLETAASSVLATAHDAGVSLRRAAYALGIRRVAEARSARGLFP
jgi:glutamate dehydrogenase (NAD(P)+)